MKLDFLTLLVYGGGNNGSTAILKVFSNTYGISLDWRLELRERSGLALISIKYSFLLLSIMKSNPNNYHYN